MNYIAALLLFAIAMTIQARPLAQGERIRGWSILSDDEASASIVIAAAKKYDINHLQLSHEVVMNLCDLRAEKRRSLVAHLTSQAHAAGIDEVAVWDHALYSLDYYPERFRTGPGGTIDLDNPDFWQWFRADYRSLLDQVPSADAIVLTFIETGARVERQHSTKLLTSQEKLAALVNTVADIVIGERRMNLYIRTFSYSQQEYDSIIGAVERISRPEVRLMMKETPHDFFLTHPVDSYAGKINRSTLIEFDAAGEFNGQGVIANTWPQVLLTRWRTLSQRKPVVGYVARTDRYGNTHIVGRPGEINLWALKRGSENPDVRPEKVYEEFIAQRYGKKTVKALKEAFQNAEDIVTSSLYTLGTNTTNHSKLDYHSYASSYARHVSGKWLNPPVSTVGHGVDRKFHYWIDVVNHLAPAWAKTSRNDQLKEVPGVVKAGWLQPGEQMNGEYLGYIVREKNWGVRLAEESLARVAAVESRLRPEDATELRVYFERTLATARLHRATANAYFGFRVWCQGDKTVAPIVQEGLAEIDWAAKFIRDYPVRPPEGEWRWVEDPEKALEYARWIQTGWPTQTHGEAESAAGCTFPVPGAIQ